MSKATDRFQLLGREDLVMDFRSQGVHIAFAMVGNRIDRPKKREELWRDPDEHEDWHFFLRCWIACWMISFRDTDWY